MTRFDDREATARMLAAETYNLLTPAELKSVGYSSSTIARRRASGEWDDRYPGVLGYGPLRGCRENP